MMLTRFLTAGVTLAPGLAAACGGLFCNNAQPVTQAAERILFAHDGERMQMHVRISYQGPPSEFGWLLPVPPDVQTALSSEALFTQLDQRFAPLFRLNFECDFEGGEGGAGGAGGEPGVQVLSREAIGPYDRSILQAESVDRLLDWLAENDYQVPPGSEGALQPYIDLGAAFVAIKLLPGADSNDIVPLRLSFTGDAASVPIRPTAVAAEPDMGVIIHLLGPSRAVSTNYLHVEINEAAIDWLSGGANYPDVVSQAADEAGGRAFATDYAGAHNDFVLVVPDAAAVANLEAAVTLGEVLENIDLSDADLQRILRGAITPPDGLSVEAVLAEPFLYGDLAVDGAAIAAQVTAEVVEVREPLNDLFDRHPYLTRMYTTLSPAEMIDDPIFVFNPDLEDQSNVHTADAQGCGDPDDPIVLGDGRMAGEEPIQRQEGETVRGQDQAGALLIERQFAAGQSEILDGPPADMGVGGSGGMGGGAGGGGGSQAEPDAGSSGSIGGGGCDCSTTGDGPGLGVLLLGLLGLRTRKKSPLHPQA